MDRSAWLAVLVLAGVVLGAWVPRMPWLIAGVGVALLGAALLARRSFPVALAGLCLGVVAVQTRPPGPVLRGAMAVHGRVVSAPVGRTAELELFRGGPAQTGWREIGGRVRIQVSGRAPPPGTELIGWGQARPVTAEVLPGAPSPILGSLLSTVRTQVDLRRWSIVGPRPRRPLPPGRHGGVLHALAWGDRSAVDPELVARLRRTGTVHLLSISGFHVGLVSLLVGGLVDRLLRLAAVWRARGLPRGWAVSAGAAAGLVYAVAAGSPVGGVRAAMVLGLLALVRTLGGRPRPLAILLVVAAAVGLLDPGALMGPSFQLSFGAVLGMVRLMPTALAWRPRWWPRVLNWAWTSAAVTICATTGTLPALGWWFQELALLPIVANLVAVPVVSLVLVPLAMVHALGIGALNDWVGALTDGVVDALMWTLAWVDVAPVSVVLTPVGAASLAVALWLHRREIWLIALLVCTAPGMPAPAQGLRVTIAEVGAGSAVLAEWADGRIWLIDGGARSDAVLHWLRRRGVRRLDVVVASQGRRDHAGGLEAVVRHLRVGEVWIPPGSRHDPDLVPLIQAAIEREVPVIPDPPSNLASSARSSMRSEADRGLVLALESGGWSVLLPSDLGPAGLSALAVALPNRVAAAVMPSHGSARTADMGWLGGQRPAVAVSQSGRWERHARPHSRAVDAWRELGARVLRTDLDGTVELSLAHGRVEVRTWSWREGWQREPAVPLMSAPWTRAGFEAQPAFESTDARSSTTKSSSSTSSSSSSSEAPRFSMNR